MGFSWLAYSVSDIKEFKMIIKCPGCDDIYKMSNPTSNDIKCQWCGSIYKQNDFNINSTILDQIENKAGDKNGF